MVVECAGTVVAKLQNTAGSIVVELCGEYVAGVQDKEGEEGEDGC